MDGRVLVGNREIFFLRVTRGGERRRGLTRVIREWKVLVFVGLKVMEEVSKFVDLIEDYRKRKWGFKGNEKC